MRALPLRSQVVFPPIVEKRENVWPNRDDPKAGSPGAAAARSRLVGPSSSGIGGRVSSPSMRQHESHGGQYEGGQDEASASGVQHERGERPPLWYPHPRTHTHRTAPHTHAHTHVTNTVPPTPHPALP